VAALTWYAIIRLANGNRQRVQVLADNWMNARLMIEAQYGRESIISGPHRLNLMRAI
jgi:hypothetical protein